MKWSMKALKRVMWTILLGSSLAVGLASTASAQNRWYDRDWKRHQKEEKHELKRHQKLEQQDFGNTSSLRRHQKEEKRDLKRHQKHEKRRSDWPYRY